MSLKDTDTWCLPDTLQSDRFLAKLCKKFKAETDSESSTTATFCDSFDWRLYRQGFIIKYSGGGWSLFRRESGECIVSQDGPLIRASCFVGEFPQGKLKDIINPILDIRSLLPIVTLTDTVNQVRILNKDEKTVVRVFLHEQHIKGSEQIFRSVELEGIRGYDQKLTAVRTFLKKCEISKPTSSLAGLEIGLKLQGREPLDYSSKFSLQLDPDLTSRQAVIEIYKNLLSAMRCNIPGIIDDLDSEFLHDFRVAIRRTRSGLSLIKKVLPQPVVDEFKKEFAFLGRITGPTRDLDVYLLYEEAYKSRLPESLQHGMHTFFADLGAQRLQEQKKLTRALRAPRCSDILDKWERYLDSEDKRAVSLAEVPVIDIAKQIIHKRYKRVLKSGAAITPKTPDEDIHRLRIEGKKLRYSIEFFKSLFPKKDIKIILKQLKQLQNNLGAFNDLSVQQEMLNRYLSGIRPGSRRNFEVGAAIGGLMSNLYKEQNKVREEFAETFIQFRVKENVELFNALFN